MSVPTAFDRRLVPAMVLGAVLNPVNSSIIAVALVPVGIGLGAPPSQTAWLVTGLYLATAVGQPVVGRLVDQHGPRRLFLAGSVLVGAGGLLGALAPSIWVLVAARVLVGLGTCAGFPAAMNLVRREADRTGQESPAGILTVLSVATQTVAVVGPTLGGLLIGVGGWRATFAVNVPLAAASFALGALRLPRTAPTAGRAAAPDVVGIALFTTTIVTLLLFLTGLEGGLGPGRSALLVVSVLTAVALVRWELHRAEPFLDLRVLGGNGALLVTYLRALLAATVSYSLLYGYTQWLEQGRGLSPSVAGLALLPVFATGILVVATTGRRPQVRARLVVGALGQVVLALLLLTLGGTSPLWLLVVVALLAGIPQGLNNLAVQNSVYHQADPARVASSAGLMRTFFYLGAIVSSTTGGVVFRSGATTGGLHDLALVMLGAAAVFLVITVADRSLSRVVPRPG